MKKGINFRNGKCISSSERIIENEANINLNQSIIKINFQNESVFGKEA